jgi:uncharacterized protein (DUF1330 family)
MSSRLALVVGIKINSGREAEYERFENTVAKIIGRHGGAVERRIALEPGGDASRPHEVHIVTFPDRAAFERYRADPEIATLAAQRAEAIQETTYWIGADLVPFGASRA